MDNTSLLLDGPGVFISVEGKRKIDYGSCTFHIWAESMNRLDPARTRALERHEAASDMRSMTLAALYRLGF